MRQGPFRFRSLVIEAPTCRKRGGPTGSALPEPKQPTTLGFAIARRTDAGWRRRRRDAAQRWYARTRITLARNNGDSESDPTTVILGLKPNEPLPDDTTPRAQVDEDLVPANRADGEEETNRNA